MNAPSNRAGKTAGSTGVLVFLGGLLLILIVLMAVNFGLVARQSAFDKQYIAQAGELRILSQRIAKSATEVVRGRVGAAQSLRELRNQFEQGIRLLQKGDANAGLPPSPAPVQPALGAVQEAWRQVRANADTMASQADVITVVHDLANSFRNTVPRMQVVSDQVVEALIKAGAPQDQIYIASRQTLLLERILKNVGYVLQGGLEAVNAADSFGRDTALFGRVLTGLLDGDKDLKVPQIKIPEARALLEDLRGLFASASASAGKILENSAQLFQLGEAADAVSETSNELLASSSALEEAYGRLESRRLVSSTSGYAMLGVAVLVLLALGYRYVQDSRARLLASTDQNQRNQAAILRLLDEMGDLADGDLTVQATVTEDFTGAIADSVNFAVEQLRNLASAINDTSARVSSAAAETQATANQLAEASGRQAQEIAGATAAINEIAVSIEGVSAHANESAAVASRAVQIAKKGSETVQNTIRGMDNIREQIQETAKRIKRLGESSQEIGNIVSLINDIAEQTNILALNAAIQAATAGEAGLHIADISDPHNPQG